MMAWTAVVRRDLVAHGRWCFAHGISTRVGFCRLPCMILRHRITAHFVRVTGRESHDRSAVLDSDIEERSCPPCYPG